MPDIKPSIWPDTGYLAKYPTRTGYATKYLFRYRISGKISILGRTANIRPYRIRNLIFGRISDNIKQGRPSVLIILEFRFSRVSLGNLPPRIGGIKCYDKVAARYILYENKYFFFWVVKIHRSYWIQYPTVRSDFFCLNAWSLNNVWTCL